MFIGILLKLTMKEKKNKKTQSIITEKIRKLINVMLLQYKITIRKNINIRAVNTVS